MPNLIAESHFASAPAEVMNRSVFDRSNGWKGSVNAGNLNCFYVDEVLPGDTIQMNESMLARMTTPIFPVMDSCYIDQYFFFVPMRLVWEHTKEFFGEKDINGWTDPDEYIIPQLDVDESTRYVGDLAHQFGIPYAHPAADNQYQLLDDKVNALPFRAYRLIWNEWFRDQNIQQPKLVNTGDTESDTTLTELLPVARVHDFFGSMLPSTQLGDSVALSLASFSRVYASNDATISSATAPADLSSLKMGYITYDASGAPVISQGSLARPLIVGTSGQVGAQNSSGSAVNYETTPLNLIAEANTVDVNGLRLAVQTQRILEKLLRAGHRYSEIIRSFFGTISPDARQQRPELLGHSRQYVNMNEVTQTSPYLAGENTTPLGTVGAYSKTYDKKLAFEYSATEHGYILGLFCIRHNRSYSQGIEKMWKRKTVFDFYNPSLAHIGEQPVYTSELYAYAYDAAGSVQYTDDPVLGYQEAWAEYRFKPSHNTGLLDPYVPGTIGDVWTYGDVYAERPVLSPEFIQEGNTEVQRTLAVQDEDQFIVDAWFDSKWLRVMPVNSVPGLVDHF